MSKSMGANQWFAYEIDDEKMTVMLQSKEAKLIVRAEEENEKE